MLRFAPGVMGGPSVDEWLLGTLRLSRRVDMRLHSHGEYLISLNPPAEFTPEPVTA